MYSLVLIQVLQLSEVLQYYHEGYSPLRPRSRLLVLTMHTDTPTARGTTGRAVHWMTLEWFATAIADMNVSMPEI